MSVVYKDALDIARRQLRELEERGAVLEAEALQLDTHARALIRTISAFEDLLELPHDEKIPDLPPLQTRRRRKSLRTTP